MSSKAKKIRAVLMIGSIVAVALTASTGRRKPGPVGPAEAYTLGNAVEGMFFSLDHDAPRHGNVNKLWSISRQKGALDAHWYFASAVTGRRKPGSIGPTEAYAPLNAVEGMFFSLDHDAPRQGNVNKAWSISRQKGALDAHWYFASDAGESIGNRTWILYCPATEDNK